MAAAPEAKNEAKQGASLNEWTELLKKSTVSRRTQLQNSSLFVLGAYYNERDLFLLLSLLMPPRQSVVLVLFGVALFVKLQKLQPWLNWSSTWTNSL